MASKKLVVGQSVDMFSGVYFRTGKVVKVTPDGVWVDTHYTDPVGKPVWPGAHYFDANGKGDPHQGTYECGPWELKI